MHTCTCMQKMETNLASGCAQHRYQNHNTHTVYMYNYLFIVHGPLNSLIAADKTRQNLITPSVCAPVPN